MAFASRLPNCVRIRPRLEILEDRLSPATFTVNSTGDTGQGSGNSGDLRYCLTQANGGGTNLIQFDPTVFGTPQTILLGSTLPTVTDNGLTIQGPGSGLVTISGNHAVQVLNITAANVTLNSLTIANGNSSSSWGGISFTGTGTLTITNCVISGNAGYEGGGLFNGQYSTVALNNSLLSGNSAFNGGGVFSNGTVTLASDTLSGNYASNVAGGLYEHGGGTATLTNVILSGNSAQGGGGIAGDGTTSLTNCTLSGNVARYGGGIGNGGTLTLTNSTLSSNSAKSGYGLLSGQGGGVFTTGGTATLTNDTLSGNYAANLGGGIYNNNINAGTLTLTDDTLSGNSARNGGGLYIRSDGGGPMVTLTNTTLSGNSAQEGGGLYFKGAAEAFLTLTNATLTGNTAQTGGGLYIKGSTTATLNNTLAAVNTATTSNPDVFGSVSGTSGFNLIGDGTGLTGISNGVNGNQIGTSASPINPLLAPLGSWGGPTQTTPLLPGSPALAAGNASLSGLPATDQRGDPRTRNGTVDIGAFESRGFLLLVTAGDNQSATVNTSFGSPLTVQVGSSFAEPVIGGTVKFTPPSGNPSATLSAPAGTINSSGKASVNATANTVAGSYQVTASADPVGTAAVFHLTNSPGAATHFKVTAPNMVKAGTAFNVTVTALDQFANVATGYAGTVRFTSSDKGTGVVLPAPYTFVSKDMGKHTFKGVVLVTLGSQTITATDKANVAIKGTVHLTVIAGPTGPALVPGNPLSGQFSWPPGASTSGDDDPPEKVSPLIPPEAAGPEIPARSDSPLPGYYRPLPRIPRFLACFRKATHDLANGGQMA